MGVCGKDAGCSIKYRDRNSRIVELDLKAFLLQIKLFSFDGGMPVRIKSIFKEK
jgi:hypothetical protein